MDQSEDGLGTMDLKNQSMQLNFRSEIFERKRKVPLVRVWIQFSRGLGAIRLKNCEAMAWYL